MSIPSKRPSDEHPPTLRPEGALNLSRVAYERFKEALFERRLQPGAFMSQAELVEIVGSPWGRCARRCKCCRRKGW